MFVFTIGVDSSWHLIKFILKNWQKLYYSLRDVDILKFSFWKVMHVLADIVIKHKTIINYVNQKVEQDLLTR